MTGWHAGPVENADATEALTSVMIQINRRHILNHAGIKTGRPGMAADTMGPSAVPANHSPVRRLTVTGLRRNPAGGGGR